MKDLEKKDTKKGSRSTAVLMFVLLAFGFIPWIGVMLAGAMSSPSPGSEIGRLTTVWFTYAISYILSLLAFVFFKQRRSYIIPLIHIGIAGFLLLSLEAKIKKNNERYNQYFIEMYPSFCNLKFFCQDYRNWIRDPENLLMINESIKKVGYDKLEHLLTKGDNYCYIYSNGGLLYSGFERNFNHLVDSLLLSYNNPEIKEKYYVEFWNRRKKEKNDSMVYKIISEYNSFKLDSNTLNYDDKYVNDTLVDLLRIEYVDVNVNEERAEANFYKLKEYGLHQSAYNMIFNREEYSELKLDREKLKSELIESAKKQEPWIVITK